MNLILSPSLQLVRPTENLTLVIFETHSPCDYIQGLKFEKVLGCGKGPIQTCVYTGFSCDFQSRVYIAFDCFCPGSQGWGCLLVRAGVRWSTGTFGESGDLDLESFFWSLASYSRSFQGTEQNTQGLREKGPFLKQLASSSGWLRVLQKPGRTLTPWHQISKQTFDLIAWLAA